MSCIAVPTPPLPVLPSPLSITPPAPPAVPGVPNLCCKLPIPPSPALPVPIPAAILNPALIATLNGYVASALAFIRALPPPCPRQ